MVTSFVTVKASVFNVIVSGKNANLTACPLWVCKSDIIIQFRPQKLWLNL